MSLFGTFDNEPQQYMQRVPLCSDNYIVLMHKNIPVAEYKIDDYTGRIISEITVMDNRTFHFRYNLTCKTILPQSMQCKTGWLIEVLLVQEIISPLS